MNTKDLHIANLIRSRINAKDSKAEVILFGSRARGQADEESDWDVLILIDKPKKDRKIEELYRNEMFLLELELGEPISTLVYSKKDWETKYAITPLYQNIKEEGIRL